MGKLYEICSTKNCFTHKPLIEFGKKYYQDKYSCKIICEECMNAYLDEASSMIAEEIIRIHNSFKPVRIYNSIKPSRYNNVTLSPTIILNDYMRTILPIIFKIDVNKTSIESEEIVNNEEDSEVNIINGDFNVISVEEKFDFNFICNLYKKDTKEILVPFIRAYLSQYIKYRFDEIPPEIVQQLMDDALSNDYCSKINTSSCSTLCKECQVSCSNDYYIMENHIYCLDCMYNYVIKMSVQQNLSEEIGIAIKDPPCDSNVYNIYNTTEWKHVVIDKYILYMKSIGFDPNIIHCIVTVQG